MLKKPKRLCENCGKALKGRSDQRFCSTQCKNEHHNAALEDGEKVYKRVLKILRENRKILKEVLGEKKTLNIAMSKLIAKGFDNDYLTHQKPSRIKGDMYYYVFDFGYKIIDDTTVMVVKAFQ